LPIGLPEVIARIHPLESRVDSTRLPEVRSVPGSRLDRWPAGMAPVSRV